MLVTIDHSAEGDELWGMGLGCRGVIELLAEPPEMAAETLEALRAARAEGRPTYLLTGLTAIAEVDRDRGGCARRTGGPGGGPWRAGRHRRGGPRPDPDSGIANSMRHLAASVPGARLEEFESAHMVNLEHPERFNRVLRAFLDGILRE